MEIKNEDKGYLNKPNDYALIKESHNGIDFYSIYKIVDSKIMMSIHDDFEYAIVLGDKMFDHGVAVFNAIDEIEEWIKTKGDKISG